MPTIETSFPRYIPPLENQPDPRLTVPDAIELAEWASKYWGTLGPIEQDFQQDLARWTGEGSIDEERAYFNRHIFNSALSARNAGQYLSPRLRGEGSSARLSMRQEVGEYLGQLLPGRMEVAQGLQLQLGGLALNADKLDACAVVPAAAAQEIRTLPVTLEQYARQDIDPDRWAIYIHINSYHGGQEAIDHMRRTVDIAQKQYPHLPLKPFVRHYLPGHRPDIGQIRSEAWDAMMLDVMSHNVDRDLLGFSHDADITLLTPSFIDRTCQVAAENPEKDIFTSRYAFNIQGDPNSDINRIIRYFDSAWQVQSKYLGRIDVSDGNAAIRVATAAAVGSFPQHAEIGEFNILRERIAGRRADLLWQSAAREDPMYQDIVGFVEGERMEVSDRRLNACVRHGIAPDDAWTNTVLPFRLDDDPARAEVPRTDTPLNPEDIKRILDRTDEVNFKDFDRKSAEHLRDTYRTELNLPL